MADVKTTEGMYAFSEDCQPGLPYTQPSVIAWDLQEQDLITNAGLIDELDLTPLEAQAIQMAQTLKAIGGNPDWFVAENRYCLASYIPNQGKCLILIAKDTEIDPDNWFLNENDDYLVSNITR